MARPTDIDTIEEEFTRFLNDGKFRKTPERFAILRKAFAMPTHFDVETLHHAMEEDGYHVSLATVYNTVELLEKAGVLRKNHFDAASATYELKRDNHFHFVCRKCGSIREVSNQHIAAEVMRLSQGGFKPEGFSIIVTGLCAECRKSIDQ